MVKKPPAMSQKSYDELKDYCKKHNKDFSKLIDDYNKNKKREAIESLVSAILSTIVIVVGFCLLLGLITLLGMAFKFGFSLI